MLSPFLQKTLVSALIEKMKAIDFTLLCGVPYAAIPLATVMLNDFTLLLIKCKFQGLMMQSGVPLLLARKDVKDYGTKKMIEGDFVKGQQVLVIEDVTVLGWSIQETAQVCK